VTSSTDTLRIHAKSPKYRYVDVITEIYSPQKFVLSCHYLKSGQSACMFRISQGFPWCQDGRYIADSTTITQPVIRLQYMQFKAGPLITDT
jgi:hypothetical protein